MSLYEPRWVPINGDGTHWHFNSWKGRRLGTIIKFFLVGRGKPFFANRVCCDLHQQFQTMEEAKAFVQKTLHCEYCAQKHAELAAEYDRFAN